MQNQNQDNVTGALILLAILIIMITLAIMYGSQVIDLGVLL